MRSALALVLSTFPAVVCAQATEQPTRFEAADVHISPPGAGLFPRTGPARGARYEAKNASMLDLIRVAYTFQNDKILGGPSWLEMDRYDVIGKVPPRSTPESHKVMLQELLKERFNLKIHNEDKPLPAYFLTAGKKPLLKPAEGSEEPGCKPQTASGAPAEGGMRIMFSTSGSAPASIQLGPGGIVQYSCRNLSMATFVTSLPQLLGAQLGPNPIRDETGLKGNWNFDLKYSMRMVGPMMTDTGSRISIFDAIDKQLGLKLEERSVPTQVIVVDSVNRKPSENPPGTAEALPPVRLPAEFEVASIKPVEGNMRMMRYQLQPGGRLHSEGMPLRFLIGRAFNRNNDDEIVGVPAFAQSDRYDLNAVVGGEGASLTAMDTEATAPMLLALLKDRFKLAYHTEERPVNVYVLVASKPKMKRADPETRAFCKNVDAPAGAPPGSRALQCQNVTMEQLAPRLQNLAPGINSPVFDETELDGTWDFTVTFSPQASMQAMMRTVPGRTVDVATGGGGAGAMPEAAAPVAGLTVFEALEKQLGLKLEKRKRTASVIVIDHLEQRPTEN